MANKAGNSKSAWSDTRKKSQSAAATAREKRKAERVAKQRTAASLNKTMGMTPWELAKAERKKRREGLTPQPRTNCGNILVKGEDGIQRVKPGSDREIEMALKIRQAEAQREADAQKQHKARKLKKAS